MREAVEKRLAELRAEYENGTKQLADLEQRSRDLREVLLRISGGIQVLSELEAGAEEGPVEPAAEPVS